MRYKMIFGLIAVIVMGTVQFNASTVYASDGSVIDKGSVICANDTYRYELDSQVMAEADIIASDDSSYLTSFNANNGVFELIFPANIKNLGIYIYEFESEGKTLLEKVDFEVADCGYESVTEDYKLQKPKVAIEKSDLGIKFTNPEIEGYKLYINQITDDDDGQSKQVHLKSGSAEIELESDVVQITEEYPNQKGELKDYFYEIDLSDDLLVRQIKNTKLSVIEPLKYIDIDTLIRIILGLISLIALWIIKIKLAKKYRFEKRAHKKRKQLRMQQESDKKNAEKEEIIAKQKKLNKQKREKLDSERRANLQVRK